jgi:colanic acid/amylovoran biosynthesis glycosyltransferase
MLGAGFACVYARSFRRNPPGLIHAAWSGAPATAAWLLWRLDGHRFTTGAHAYDIFEHGGDWWLKEKLDAAVFVHTSTEVARDALVASRGRGGQGRVHPQRPGAAAGPEAPALLAPSAPPARSARLVEKKGLDRQLRIYAALKAAGVDFEARIVGDGPLRAAAGEAGGPPGRRRKGDLRRPGAAARGLGAPGLGRRLSSTPGWWPRAATATGCPT